MQYRRPGSDVRRSSADTLGFGVTGNHPPAPEPRSRMNKLIFANLLHRPLRSLISILAVAIEVMMILSIVAIFMGMVNDSRQRQNGIGADLVMLPSGASLISGLSTASMPVNDAIAIRRL